MTLHDWIFGVTEFWVGSAPVWTIPPLVWHRITKKRHEETLAAIREGKQ